MKTTCAVSVIIPMYNAEKYLGVCLESILIQTLTDFEVIIVDDCSTDSSLAIAESYLEKFGGRLKIITLEANTGSGAVPRNIGLEYARGKYICFVDNDDLLIDVALEELYNCAEEYKADVVYAEALLMCDAEPIPKKFEPAFWEPSLTVDKPTLETDDFTKRIEKFVEIKIRWTPWGKFLRRDFLIDNGIRFLPLKIIEDGIWTLELLCLAERWLRIPTPFYVYRSNENSITGRKRSPEQLLKFWTNPLITGIDYLDKFMSRFEFFRQHPNYNVRVLNVVANECFQFMRKAFKELEPRELYEIFRQEFQNDKEHAALIAYLLFITNTYRNELLNK